MRRSLPRSNEPGRQPLAKIKLSLLFKRRMTSYSPHAFTAAKFGVVGLTKSVALELAKLTRVRNSELRLAKLG